MHKIVIFSPLWAGDKLLYFIAIYLRLQVKLKNNKYQGCLKFVAYLSKVTARLFCNKKGHETKTQKG